MLLLKGEDIHNLLKGREGEIIEIISSAYAIHASGECSLPHSSFVHFLDNVSNRIIALPAYVGGDIDVAGIKWIASFPGNLSEGLERASATLILNSSCDGTPLTIMEGSIISAKRTAASAALAVRFLYSSDGPLSIGIIGCGMISFEILHFILSGDLKIETIYIFDLDFKRSERFKEKCQERYANLKVIIAKSYEEVYAHSEVLSFATTASRPYVDDLSHCRPECIILNISLRDLSPEIILSNSNIVDDIDHVCRADTSVHLAEQRTGHRDFIHSSIGEIITGRAIAPKAADKKVIFSPFGLGILDVALAHFAYKQALEENIGMKFSDFIYKPWYDR